jgi:hypothetical protein
MTIVARVIALAPRASRRAPTYLGQLQPLASVGHAAAQTSLADRFDRAVHTLRASFRPRHSKATGEVGLGSLSMANGPRRVRACRCCN